MEKSAGPIPITGIAGTNAVYKTASPGNRWALIVGIDHYQDSDQTNRLSTLTGAVGDANALAETLAATAGFPKGQIKTLTNEKATRRDILIALDHLKAQVKKGDTVFLFFSGHGCEDVDAGKNYMLTYDAATDSIPLLKQTALDISDFTEPLRHLPARLILLAFDMCRVEVGRDGVSQTTDTFQNRGQDFSELKGKTDGQPTDDTPGIVVKWWACSPKEKSYEMIVEKRGYFSYFMEQGLRGKAAAQPGGAVTLADLGKWVGPTVAREVQRREGRKQTPRLAFDGVTDLSQLSEIVLIGSVVR